MARMTTPQTTTASNLLNEHDAAAYLGLKNPRTLAAWRLRRRGPSYVKIGACVRYKPADLEKFVEANHVDPQSAS